jgi:thiamine biosynthesis lipoprotein
LACHARSDGAFDITSGVLRAAWNFSGWRAPEQYEIDALLPRIGLGKVTLSENRLSFGYPAMELDFGGVAKEYAADRAAELCAGLGIRVGFVRLAGDIRTIGPLPDGLPWRIGIRDPQAPDALIGTVALHNGALATSGDYERFIEIDGRRYCHILDPVTGWPCRRLASVTVIAPSCLIAGSLATAAMVKGNTGSSWLQRQGVRHLAVDSQGGISGTEPAGAAGVRWKYSAGPSPHSPGFRPVAASLRRIGQPAVKP